MILDRCSSFDTALDCGAGSGQASFDLAARFARVVALDSSPSQLEFLNRDARITTVLGRAEELPFQEASFDLVTAAEAAHWFDWDAFVTEAFRVLRPGGGLLY